MERGGESIAPVPIPNRGSVNVFRQITGARKDGVRYERFGQETDTTIALHELAGLRRGKNQLAKELADSLSLERICESGEGGATCFPNGSGRGSAVEVRRAKLSDLGDGGGNRRDPGMVYKKSSPTSQAGGTCLQQERAILDKPTSYSTKYTRATNQ